MEEKHVVIIGGGFGGINVAKKLGKAKGLRITLIDRKNHHLFQPLLYQVAMAGLSPAEIATPIRSLLSNYKNTQVFQGNVEKVDLENQRIHTGVGEYAYDYLVLACGAKHTYFGNSHWEQFAPGLKTLEQATEIRRRVLYAFEKAELEKDSSQRKKLLTFIVVGGGPTGVELAGAIGEMSRHTLAKDFRNIDPKLTRVILIEAGPQILVSFHDHLASKAMRDLEKIGVQVWTSSMVSEINQDGVTVGNERIEASTILWAAGVQGGSIVDTMNVKTDRQKRIFVEEDLSIPGFPNAFVIGDQAHFHHGTEHPLPGVATVAIQQGDFLGKMIKKELKGKERSAFRYFDKGKMATIGKSKAILEVGRLRMSGRLAWYAWLLVHIYYLSGFKNRIFVLFQWSWSYFSFRRGARLIVNKQWRSYPDD